MAGFVLVHNKLATNNERTYRIIQVIQVPMKRIHTYIVNDTNNNSTYSRKPSVRRVYSMRHNIYAYEYGSCKVMPHYYGDRLHIYTSQSTAVTLCCILVVLVHQSMGMGGNVNVS